MAGRWLTIVLPKGRLAAEAAQLVEAAGLARDLDPQARTLVHEEPDLGIRLAWLRPEDGLTYAERGVAALAFVGKDVLLERRAAVDEVVDLGIGRCTACLAVPEDAHWPPPAGTRLRVATHLPRLAEEFLRRQGHAAEIIHLRGSVEIAPRLGLADAVVDLVQTGRTLQANALKVAAEIMPITCRLVAHPGARRAGDPRVEEIIERLARAAAAVPAGGGGSR
ncbi:MAG: ATP phosphoribosyltransferase [Bacillota bacterium]|nr:MAG: ATP phosphoribosyltransferase [Bacillota bacterium]